MWGICIGEVRLVAQGRGKNMKSNSTIVLWVIGLVVMLSTYCVTAVEASGRGSGGWEVSAPEQQKMNSKILDEMDTYANKNFSQIHSILIIRHGNLVFEKYYNGYDQHKIQHINSVTKTFTGALIGIAIDKGYIKDINSKLVDFYPEYVTAKSDPRIKDITIEHLLTMTSGFAWQDWGDGLKAEESKDPLKYIMERPFDSQPGEKFNYNSGGFYLLSAIITKSTGMKASAFADKYLFSPLGIVSWEWWEDKYTLGGLGLNLRPRDMGKFGLLYLNDGQWNGDKIVPAEWIKASTIKKNDGGVPHGENYGDHCWVTTVHGYSAYFAGGYGGQFIYVVPALDLVVAITSGWDRHHEEHRLILVDKFIIPAVLP